MSIPSILGPRRRVVIISSAVVLVLLAVFTVRVPAPPPTIAPIIRIRWAPSVDADERVARESSFRLRRGAPHSDRTWSYDLLDASRDNIRALITDPAVEDTDGVDRREFRIAIPSVTIAERLTAEFAVLERMAGPGFRDWVSPANAWPAALAAAWLIGLSRPSVRAAVFSGIPALSPVGLGLFRIVLGLALLIILPDALGLPAAPLPRALHRAADWFADWEWVHRLAMNSDTSSLIVAVAMAALAFFAAGVLPRVMYLIALAAITAVVFVLLQHRSAHDWGLPLVALWGLVLVPWDAGLTLVPFRHERGEDTPRHGYAVWFPGAVLGLGLLAAAYAKLDTSGLEWVTGGAVKYHFIEDFGQAPTAWGLWIAAHPASAVAASFCAIAVESLFILHVFVRQPLVRAMFGMAALSLLAGLYVLQGVFWCQWWILLLAFVPWESLAARVPRLGVSAPGKRPSFRPLQVALVGAIVCIQLFASARRVEVEPFVSDYGMYSWTWTSTSAFDQHVARKYRAYRYAIEDSSGVIDITGRLRSLPKASDALTDAVDRVRDGGDLSTPQREALRAIAAMYQSAFDAPAGRVTVLLDEQAFDWTLARFYRKVEGKRIGVVDLPAGVFIPAA
jgi:hypothetical protein